MPLFYQTQEVTSPQACQGFSHCCCWPGWAGCQVSSHWPGWAGWLLQWVLPLCQELCPPILLLRRHLKKKYWKIKIWKNCESDQQLHWRRMRQTLQMLMRRPGRKLTKKTKRQKDKKTKWKKTKVEEAVLVCQHYPPGARQRAQGKDFPPHSSHLAPHSEHFFFSKAQSKFEIWINPCNLNKSL